MKYKKRYIPENTIHEENISLEELQDKLIAYRVKDKYELLCKWSSMAPDIWQYWEV